MQYSKLGNSDLSVSKICLGTMTFGEQNTELEGHTQMSLALEKGVNFFDTAELYAIPSRQETQGRTETIIGSWFAREKKRDQVILATKAAGPSLNLKYIRNPIDFSPQQLRSALEGSLRRLQTDYIDLYQLHWPERHTNRFGKLNYQHRPDDPWQENFHAILDTMQTFMEEGKIRYFGISNETAWGTMRFLEIARTNSLPRCVSIQNPYSLLNRTFEVNLSEIAIREKVGLLAYSPLAFGLLSGKYHVEEKPKEARLSMYPQMARYNGQRAWDATKSYLEIARHYQISPAKMSLAFILQQAFTTSVIIGATNQNQLEENIASIDVKLDAELLQAIERIHQQNPNPAP